MITVNVSTANVSKELNAIEREQLPFATALALTRTAQRVAQDLRDQIAQKLDRPTPYTLAGVFVSPAKKTDSSPIAVAGIKTNQSQYLDPLFAGSGRDFKKFEIKLRSGTTQVVPSIYAKLNGFGNLNKGLLLSAIADAEGQQSKYFIGSPQDLPRGLYERVGKAVKPLLIFIDEASYAKTLSLDEALRLAEQVFDREFDKALAGALS
jgi:hypothetical protein